VGELFSRLLESLCPDEYLDSVLTIDLQALKGRGVQAILVDLDNTIVGWRRYDVSPEMMDWLKRVREEGIKLCIVSNARAPRRLRLISSTLGIPFARKGFKPRRRGFREALGLLGVEPHMAVAVGDQIFTDVLGGNRLGLYTILVRPLHTREFAGTKITRFFERLLLRILTRRRMLRVPAAEPCTSGEQFAGNDSHIIIR